MKMFEPKDGIPWIGLTLTEEKILAECLLNYTSSNGLSPHHDTILMSRIDTGVIRAEDFVAFLESMSDSIDGVPDIEWNDDCEENKRDDIGLLADRLWVWKNLWDNWTKERLEEFPGNEKLNTIDNDRFTNHEIERATEKEMTFWQLYEKNVENMPDLSADDIYAMTLDQSPRGEDVIPNCLKDMWKEMEPEIIEEIMK